MGTSRHARRILSLWEELMRTKQHQANVDDRGAASLFAIALLALVMVGALLTAAIGEVVIDRAQAQTAADAAALAGVVEGEQAARKFAQANNAELGAFTAFGSRVRVTVQVGRVSATAVAERRERVVWPSD